MCRVLVEIRSRYSFPRRGVVVECEYAAINKAKRGRLAVQGHGGIGVLEESKATGQSE